uniref:PB1 domain-containing protein n=1 Tax=Amphimedon queenslandica TaxID=400682 RepID=A0A1X7V2Z3_AMPQE
MSTAGAAVNVLITYKTQKKVLSVRTDLGATTLLLKDRFVSQFNVDCNASVSFQRYDSRFDEYVDLSEDDTIEDCDKLIAIVSNINDQELVSSQLNCETLPQKENGCSSLDDPTEQPDALAIAKEVVITNDSKYYYKNI